MKFKTLVKQIPNIIPNQVDDFCIDIEFELEKKFVYIGDLDKYGEYSEEELYVPFNDKNYRISISNIQRNNQKM